MARRSRILISAIILALIVCAACRAPGGVKRLYDKELGRNVLDTGKFLGFEVFTMRSVGNGAGEFGRVQQPTMEGFDKLSLHRPRWRLVDGESGPVRTVYLLEQPLRNCTVRQRLIVYHGIKKIDCEVSLLGWDGEPYREFRLALPFASPNILLSTMKKAENDDTVILRVYDIEGKDTEAAVELFHPVKRAERTNLIEEEAGELKPRKGRLVLPVGHHAVETLKLFPAWTERQ